VKTSTGQQTGNRHNDSLLLQFIFSEQLHCLKITKTLRSNCSQTVKSRLSKEKKEQLIFEIKSGLEELCGEQRQCMRIFSWNQDGGRLHKMSNFALFFDQETENAFVEAEYLRKESNAALLTGLKCLQILEEQTRTRKVLTKTVKELLIKEVEKLEKKLKKINSILNGIAIHYDQDENVLFFILRHHEEFYNLVGPQYVVSLISNSFDNNLKKAERWLKQRYKKRGFQRLLPIIESKFHELKPR